MICHLFIHYIAVYKVNRYQHLLLLVRFLHQWFHTMRYAAPHLFLYHPVCYLFFYIWCASYQFLATLPLPGVFSIDIFIEKKKHCVVIIKGLGFLGTSVVFNLVVCDTRNQQCNKVQAAVCETPKMVYVHGSEECSITLPTKDATKCNSIQLRNTLY